MSRDAGQLPRRDLRCPPTLGQAAAAMSAVLSGDPSIPFSSVSTDSRRVLPGALFVCLRGPNFDAHDFASAAAGVGAAAVVCEKGRATDCPAPRLEVDDTLVALGELASWVRGGLDGPLVAVTGSNGKTTTKEMLRAIFTAHFGDGRVLATEGNLNNLIGVPLTLFGLGPDHDAAIVEMGMNAPGEIARLAEIARPTVGLITCVAEAHLEGLGSIQGVARAKGELFEALPEGAVAVVNLDDDHVRGQASRFTGRHFTFGQGGDMTVSEVRCDRLDASSFELRLGSEHAAVDLPLGGRHNVQNALAAAAAASAAGLPLPTIARGLSRMKAPPMRMAVETLSDGSTLINDAYNANPGSVAAALATLGGLASGSGRGGRCIVVLGDMLELGDGAAALHRRAGEQAAAIDPALLCTYGSFAGEVAAGAEATGLDPARIRVCALHEEAATEVARVRRPGDAILVKGSRGSTMEKVVEALRALDRAAAAGSPEGRGSR